MLPLEFQLSQYVLGNSLETVDFVCQDLMLLVNNVELLWCWVRTEVTRPLLVRKGRNILVAFRITEHCL